MKTKNEIHYHVAPYGLVTVIPKGTEVIPATNLPAGGHWVEAWEGMSDNAESWQRNYGFHVTDADVEEDEKPRVPVPTLYRQYRWGR